MTYAGIKNKCYLVIRQIKALKLMLFG